MAEVDSASELEQIRLEKIEWSKMMRQQFSPEGMCNEDGSINQNFFKPKKIIIQLTEDKKWGEPEKEALLKVMSAPESNLYALRVYIHTLSLFLFPTNQLIELPIAGP